ncbi:MAG TPA: alpha/beta fold hydrolase [Candidatus Saccharimonadales bacterium]|nr:alpha/beta fold hydrolase [Candidatus Saccharimonadales bacterium]
MSDPARVHALVLADGRSVSIHEVASGGGRTVVFCHASPGSGAFDPDPTETTRRGITLLALDRPGYGRSDPMPAGSWSSVDRHADDIAAVLRARGIDHVGVAGWSAGGRVALALAARHPGLVDRVVVLATPAPHEAVPWVPSAQQAGLDALRDLPPDDVHTALVEQLGPLVPRDPGDDAALDLLRRSPADDDALARPGARTRLAAMLDVAFKQGATGMATEIAGYGLRSWGFEPSDVTAKTLLLYGTADPLGGNRHARWWKDHLPNARVEMVPGAGHLLVIPMWARALSFLAPSRDA